MLLSVNSGSILGNDNLRTIICGNILTGDSLVYLHKIDYLFPFASKPLKREVKDGVFHFQINISEPTLYRLTYNKNELTRINAFLQLTTGNIYYSHPCYNYYKGSSELYIEPGDSIFVYLRINKYGYNKSEFKGDNSDENNFLIKYRHLTVNKRGNWAFPFFGLGGHYKDLKTSKIIKK